MRLNPDGSPAPYRTKVEYIEALETALNAVLQAESLEAAHLIVLSVPDRGGRWRRASPLAHRELVKAAETLQKPPGSTTGND